MKVPNDKKYKFYQCVNFDCEKLYEDYIYKENSTLIPISKYTPFFLEKPIVLYTVFSNKYLNNWTKYIFGK
jgi:hypothetical protein